MDGLQTRWGKTRLAGIQYLVNPATTDNPVFVIEDNGLTRRNRHDWRIEFHRRAVVVERRHRTGGGLMAVSNLRGHAQRSCGRGARDPVHLRCREARSLELGARADNDSLFSRPQLQNVQRLRGCDAQALALSHSKAVHAAVMSEDVT